MDRRSFLIRIAKITLSGIAVAGLPGSLMAAVRRNPRPLLGRLFRRPEMGSLGIARQQQGLAAP
jgi:hypothetical protein